MITRFERFTVAILGICRSIQKIEREEMIKYGLKGSYAQYLTVMNRFPDGITAARLSELCDKDKAAVSRAVAEMEEMELIYRDDVNDSGYRTLLKLTPDGQEAADVVREKGLAAVEIAGGGLTEEQRETMYQALEQISGNLREISRQGLPQRKQENRA